MQNISLSGYISKVHVQTLPVVCVPLSLARSFYDNSAKHYVLSVLKMMLFFYIMARYSNANSIYAQNDS